MKYFPPNPLIENHIATIRKSILLAMNGITSQSMEKAGIHYKLNYGVSVPDLRKIASRYDQNHELAQRLWALKIRETMILATLLQPIDKFTEEMADEWVNESPTVEMIEQASMNLFVKLSFATKKAIEWVNKEESFTLIAGFTLAARNAKTLSEEQAMYIIQKAIAFSTTDNFSLYRSISLCLRHIGRRNISEAEKIQQYISSFQQSEEKSKQYIYQEVKNDLYFYYEINN